MEQGFAFLKDSPRKDEPAPAMEAAVAYFERDAIPYSEYRVPSPPASESGRLAFRKTEVHLSDASRPPAVAGLTWIGPEAGRPGTLLACDMRSGGLYSISPPGEPEVIVAPGSKVLSNPCHVESCDLDGDGLMDLVVADLGNFYPTDDLFGRVVWLKRKSAADGYEPIELGPPLGRVADVQPGDFDGDGDLDLVVAEFGLIKAGRILLLENQGVRAGALKFALRETDPRHGTIHVPPADVNGDGKLDFVALISQEHEVVEAFLGRDDGTFDHQRIYGAPNPSWGSSGIQLVDMDADGDLDVLHSNGDGFDRNYLKPYHGARWLENQGKFPWVEHHLIDMPGCQRTLAGDLDGDGDLDVVAVALIPAVILDRFGRESFASICWLEQAAPGEFRPHDLELSACDHSALALGDFDADGDLDLAVGNFDFSESTGSSSLAPITFWWNEIEVPASSNSGQ